MNNMNNHDIEGMDRITFQSYWEFTELSELALENKYNYKI